MFEMPVVGLPLDCANWRLIPSFCAACLYPSSRSATAGVGAASITCTTAPLRLAVAADAVAAEFAALEPEPEPLLLHAAMPSDNPKPKASIPKCFLVIVMPSPWRSRLAPPGLIRYCWLRRRELGRAHPVVRLHSFHRAKPGGLPGGVRAGVGRRRRRRPRPGPRPWGCL